MQFDPLGSTAASPTTPTSAAPVVVPNSVPTPPSTSPAGGNTNPAPGVGPIDNATGASAQGNGPASAPTASVASSGSRRASGGGPRAPHYADEFQVYHKAKANGNGTSKRATCHHCAGDWAYNETRLKNHIIDAYRGCRKIPQATRERIRAAHARTTRPSLTSPPPPLPIGAVPPMPMPSNVAVPVVPPPEDGAPDIASADGDIAPPTKRKRESMAAGVEPGCPAGAQLRVSVEFSVVDGGLLRAQWIVAEMIQEFHRDVIVVSLVPSQSDNVFNIWIGGKIVWSRGPGQPLPDFEHLRPLVRAHVLAPPAA